MKLPDYLEKARQTKMRLQISAASLTVSSRGHIVLDNVSRMIERQLGQLAFLACNNRGPVPRIIKEAP